MTPSQPLLLPHHRKNLEDSGLSAETIRVSGCYSETNATAISEILGWRYPANNLGSCLVLPFFDLEGNQLPYRRLRPDNPRLDGGKYESPVGQGNRAYFPPLARKAASTDGATIVLVEGEKKALAGNQQGLACIGLVGVWGWCISPKRNGGTRRLIDDLQQIDWRERKVYICFDSDAVENPMVQSAAYCLMLMLKEASKKRNQGQQPEQQEEEPDDND